MKVLAFLVLAAVVGIVVSFAVASVLLRAADIIIKEGVFP